MVRKSVEILRDDTPILLNNFSYRPCSVWILREILKRNEWREINKKKLLKTMLKNFKYPK